MCVLSGCVVRIETEVVLATINDPERCKQPQNAYKWAAIALLTSPTGFLFDRIWQQIDMDDMQFGFMKGEGTTDAIFIVRQMQEKFRAKGKKLYFGYVDSEKAFDRVPREGLEFVSRVTQASKTQVHAFVT